ncbi:MAG TPA: hypothetical protein VGO93_13355 [Candidatus Xenobia bacterium]|jgi:hypothetical protein
MRRFTWLAGMLCVLLWFTPAHGQDLRDYYLGKYPTEQTQVYDQAIGGIFQPQSRPQAREEALAQSYVVYHRTRSHDVANNVGVTHAWRRTIEEACRRYGVPAPMAEGILTWENSGGTQAMSFAACAGIGQMSAGAVTESHVYASLHAMPAVLRYRGERVALSLVRSLHLPGAQSLRHDVSVRLAEANAWQTVARHRHLRAKAGVADERMLPICNIEDSVIFMRILLDAYDNLPDLAVAAYHNGMQNDDDLLHDFLKRVDPPDAGFTAYDRAPLYHALRRRHIDYLTLWNDHRCREMLNGLRTMDGDVTTDANHQEALGDESDIYVWKVSAAYAAFLASPAQLARIEGRYQGSQEQAETLGWRPSPPWATVRIAGRPLRFKPEMAGYLADLARRLTSLAGPRAGFTVVPSGAGIAADVNTSAPAALKALLYADWLFDRIYLHHVEGGHWHVCLNPRFGQEYLHHAALTAAR